VQKRTDAEWLREIEAIYAGYAIYHQSGGAEQAVFDSAMGRPSPRSMRLLGRLTARFPLNDTGRLLDVGCGNGALLRAFSAIAPNWALAGTEWSDKYRSIVEAIPGVEALHTVAPEDVPGRFAMITMIHVLEHIPSPRAYLERLADKLEPGGHLVIEVPDHRQNPFELTIADHCSHFSQTSLARLLRSAGYEVLSEADDWVAKEITVVARPAAAVAAEARTRAPESDRARVQDLVSWLVAVASDARAAAEDGHFGLFGTSIAATWLTEALGDRIRFYVDEDPDRVGKTHLGRPIYQPSDVPEGSRVFIALPTPIAESLCRRLGSDAVEYRSPPRLPARDR
jgi:trans-aconitate methyltransferase